ncbi:DUF5689 domain-containing protein [uncultured Alistipes sp.]|jgi:hypothetical protein|uniref:DUF5689 domain-containing protein n=1 Tax=uncultured Alistipes sp. TaxID=538949 RepID=UPI0025F61D0E|nr:DUF5689 domain-containing protein [uncultured Alistipes sp.]
MKTIAYRLDRLLAAALILLLAGATASCEKDRTQEKYVYLLDPDRNEVHEVSYGIDGGTQDFLMYSNYGYWTLEPTYGEDLEWLSFWPTEGVGDARFAAMVEKNETAYQRHATLNVVVGGQAVATIRFSQSGAEPTLKVNVKESGKTVSVKGETFSIGVESNIDWVAELVDPADESWVRIGDFTAASQSFTCEPNSGTAPREAKVRVSAYGTQLAVVFSIYQPDMSSAFEVADKVTIAELLAQGVGKIDRNVYVVGSVISDRATRNYPVAYSTDGMQGQLANTMFIQDETAGLWIEFENEEDNLYDPNQVVTVHMYGQVIDRDAYSNGLKIENLSTTAVQSAEAGATVEPVVIEDVSQLAAYENRLVTLRNVEFALPYGTLVNINESTGYLGKAQGAAYQASADYNDLTIEYGHYLRDAKGNTTKLYTTWSFTERALAMIPEGAGDVTGIVNKRYKSDVYDGRDEMRRKVESWCIRVRRASDITNFGSQPGSRLSRTVMQIGPWTDNKGALPSVIATVGQGQLKHSVGEDVLGSTSGNTQQMYLAWAHARCTAATYNEVTGIWSPTYGNTKGVQYIALMAQGWWKNTSAVNTDTDGCCWILSNLSTSGCTGQLSLQFTASSNTSGPMYFQMEWAETDKAAQWTPIGNEFVASNWHNTIAAPEYLFVLPDELKDRSSFSIRLRATRERNASDNEDTASGTSRIGVIRLSCLDM